MIGTILAMVTIVLMKAACSTPRRIMKWKAQMPISETTMAVTRAAVPEDLGKEAPQRRADQHPVEDVAEAAAEPVAEGRQEAHDSRRSRPWHRRRRRSR